MNNFQQRLLSSLCIIPVLLFALYSAHLTLWWPLFSLTLLAIILMSVSELIHLMERVDCQPLVPCVLFGTVLYVSALFFTLHLSCCSYLPQMALLIVLIALFCSLLHTGGHPILISATTLFPFAYLVIPLSSIASITYFFPQGAQEDGRWWTFFLVAVTKGNDTIAYFVGRSIGKRAIAPYVSPKKTWEGAIAGLCGSTGLALFFPSIIKLITGRSALVLPSFHLFPLALILGVMAQLGDFSESLLKRNAKAKDSSSLPGLGGVLDMVDSLIFSAPSLYLFLNFYYA